MALNSSGPISLAGSTAGQSIAVELGQSATGQISLNDAAVRALAGVASGAITMPTNFWGKSSEFTTLTAGSNFAVQTGVRYLSTANACWLTSTRLLMAYTYVFSQDYPVYYTSLVVIDVSGTSLTVYTPVIVVSGATDMRVGSFGLTPIDSTYCLMCMGIAGLSLVKVTGTTPSVVDTVLNNSRSVSVQQGVLSSTSYLTVQCNTPAGSSTIEASVITRSGDTLTAGSAVTLNTGLTSGNGEFTVQAVSATEAALAFRNRVYAITVSGTTPTIHSYIDASGSNYGSSTIGLSRIASTNRYLVNASTLFGGSVTAQVVTQSGSSLSSGTPRTFTYPDGSITAQQVNFMFRNSETAGAIVVAGPSWGVVNISGTTISSTLATGTNIDATARFIPVGINTTQFVQPINNSGGNPSLSARVVTAS